MPEEPGVPAVAAVVVVKLPAFWVAEPLMWFAQAEAAFRRGNITVSSTKYDHILMKLPESVLVSVRDVIQTVDDNTENPYGLLKARLLTSFGATKWQLAAKLLDYPPLGDARPSALMDNMLALLPPGERPGTLFQLLFMRRLPADMRQQLAAREFDTAIAMAAHADLLWDARGPAHHAAALEIDAVNSRHSSPADRARLPNRGSSRREQRQATPARPGMCFIHVKYGAAARNCIKPCSFQPGNAPAAPGGSH